jgi:hypothetical protein
MSLTLWPEYRWRMYENGFLRGICGPKREEVSEGWRRQHIVELHCLYASPNIIRMIKSRKMTWAVNVARMGGIINLYNILVENPDRRDHLEDLGINETILR